MYTLYSLQHVVYVYVYIEHTRIYHTVHTTDVVGKEAALQYKTIIYSTLEYTITTDVR